MGDEGRAGKPMHDLRQIRFHPCALASGEDNGEGIEPTYLERIFQPFVTTKKDGLGLGLSISRSIVSAHAGSLWAENARMGKGAVFHLTLPSADSLSVDRCPST